MTRNDGPTHRQLYPEIEPYAVHCLDAGAGHELYVEEVGNPDGIPAVFLHGGPGSGCNAGHRRYFDPACYRVVLFDQRGTGRSRPAGETRENTTSHLLADMEAIRRHLDIAQWLVFGGSWGATLALLYAQARPAQVSALVLRGSFLARAGDLEWFVGERGARLVYPDMWGAFSEAVPPGPGSVVERAAAALEAGDEATRRRVALAWSAYAGAVVTLSLPDALVDADPGPPEDPAPVIAKVRIEMHYAKSGYFLREDQVLSEMHRVPAVPTVIIHGRRDLTCPPAAAFTLARALPHATLEIVRESGHLASEAGNVDALVRATDRLATTLGRGPYAGRA